MIRLYQPNPKMRGNLQWPVSAFSYMTGGRNDRREYVVSMDYRDPGISVAARPKYTLSLHGTNPGILRGCCPFDGVTGLKFRRQSAPGHWLGDPALRYSFLYALLSGLWILTSDRLLSLFVTDTATMAHLQSFKGLFFISVSALLIYFLMRKARAHALGERLEKLSTQQAFWPMSMAMLLFSGAIIAGGLLIYHSAREEVTQKTTATLASVARLRAARMESWLRDAARMATEAASSPGFARTFDTWLDQGRTGPGMLARLYEIAETGHFHQVCLYDANGNLLLSTRPTGVMPRLDVDPANPEVVLDDFLLGGRHASSMAMPGIVLPLQRKAGGRPFAWLHVNLDQTRSLAAEDDEFVGEHRVETDLIHGVGEEFIVLTIPSPGQAPLAPVRLPLSHDHSIATQLLGGKRGALSGLDHRQMPSLAYAVPVEGTQWFVIARNDARDAFANLNRLALSAMVMLIILLGLGAWAIAVRYSRLMAVHRGEIERLSLARRYEVLVRHANDCIVIVDAAHRIVDVNDRCLAVYGYSREEMLALSETDLQLPSVPGRTSPFIGSAGRRGPLIYETRHRRRDRQSFPVEISEVAIELDGQMHVQMIIRDITERKANETRIQQLSQLSAVLSRVNHAIAHESRLEDVFDAACQACVQSGGFRLALLGLVEPGSDVMRVSSFSGEQVDALKAFEIDMTRTLPDGRSPALVTAYYEQRPSISRHCEDDPVLQACGQVPDSAAGVIVAVPILYEGRPCGVLSAYSDREDVFVPQAELLLGEIADALSFAIHHFAEEEARRQTGEALRKREAQLLKAEEVAHLGHWDIDLQTGITTWSPQMYTLFDQSPDKGPVSWEALYERHFTPDSIRLTEQGFQRAVASGQRVQVEQEMHFPGRGMAYHSTMIVPVRNALGETTVLHGTVQDVTERRLNEARLGRMAARLAQAATEYEDLYQHAPCGYHSLDEDGVFQRINETELEWLGYLRHELVGKMKLTDLMTPESVARFNETFPLLMEQGEVRDLEQTLICRNGTLLPVIINASVIRDEQGRFIMSRSTLFNMTERKRIEQEREQYLRRLAHMSRHLLNMQEEERKRLSASLHDRTSPNLAAIGLNLSTINLSFAGKMPGALMECLDDIRALLDDTTASIREISADLRPPLLDYAGLLPALEGYIYQFSRRTGMAAEFNTKGFDERPEPEIETLLFRITQEALTNCAKHAQAGSVVVTLEKTGERIILQICDDGIGFDPECLGKDGQGVGLGMLNMREMAEFSGGHFRIDARPGSGTSIRIEI